MLFISFCAVAQQVPELDKGSYENYIKKGKRQERSAWILLAGGTVLSAAGVSTVLSNINLFGDPTPEQKRKLTAGGIMLMTGSAATIACIPMFISGSRNKKQAKLMLKEESTFLPYHLQKKEFTALSLSIGL